MKLKCCFSSDVFARSLVFLDVSAGVLRRDGESTHLTLAFALNAMECKALTTFRIAFVPSPLLFSFSPSFVVAGGSHREQGVRVIKWRE